MRRGRTPRRTGQLDAIAAAAERNGVRDLQRMSPADVATLEPQVRFYEPLESQVFAPAVVATCATHTMKHRNNHRHIHIHPFLHSHTHSGIHSHTYPPVGPPNSLAFTRSPAHQLTSPPIFRIQQTHLFASQVRCTAALLSPSTGIVDSHSLMVSFQGEIENAGGIIAFNSPVKSAESFASSRCKGVSAR